MTVALRPPELGQLTIRLQFADGQLQVEVRADRPETLLLLQREADGFERSLRQAGLELRDGGLQLAAQGDGGGPAWHGVARDEAAQDGAGETATGGAAAGEGPLPHVRAPHLAANGRLDLRI